MFLYRKQGHLDRLKSQRQGNQEERSTEKMVEEALERYSLHKKARSDSLQGAFVPEVEQPIPIKPLGSHTSLVKPLIVGNDNQLVSSSKISTLSNYSAQQESDEPHFSINFQAYSAMIMNSYRSSARAYTLNFHSGLVSSPALGSGLLLTAGL